MLHEYKQRTQDFTREILANGTYAEMCKFETAILKSVDAVKNESFYNRAMNNGKGANLKPHSNHTKEKISKANIGNPKHAARGKRPLFAGTGNHFYGKSHSNETKEMMSKKAKARSQGSSNNNAMTLVINSITYYTMKEASAALSKSSYKIRQMLSTGEARRIN
jgi:hypothetical protein